MIVTGPKQDPYIPDLDWIKWFQICWETEQEKEDLCTG